MEEILRENKKLQDENEELKTRLNKVETRMKKMENELIQKNRKGQRGNGCRNKDKNVKDGRRGMGAGNERDHERIDKQSK